MASLTKSTGQVNGKDMGRYDRLAGKYRVPGTGIRLLSNPSKMPGLTWGMTAGISCPFKVTTRGQNGEAAICGGCYAAKGRYVFGDVARAYRARFDWARESMKTEEGRDAFVALLVKAIGESGVDYFRVHDSGDLFSPAYTRCWERIARALPQVKFWFPTRSWRAAWVGDIVTLASLGNVTVRPSALHVGVPVPVVGGLHGGSGVSEEGFSCPASSQGNSCGSCRACWDDKPTAITYHLH